MSQALPPDQTPTPLKLTQLAGEAAAVPPAGWRGVFSTLAGQAKTSLGQGRVWHALDTRHGLVNSVSLLPAVCDDPFDYGRIAAAHALSEALGTGAHPIIAQALLALPSNRLEAGCAERILAGAQAVCRAFDLELAAGQLIDAPQPSFGLALSSQIQLAQLKPLRAARPGDKLILARGLGSGLVATALTQGHVNAVHAAEFITLATTANSAGPLLACLEGVHALATVSGAGLFFSLLELCQAADLRATLDWQALPRLPQVDNLLGSGFTHPAVARNWPLVAASVRCPEKLLAAARTLLCAAEFAGTLLVTCAGDTVSEVLSLFLQQGCTQVAVVGEILRGTPGISLAD